MTVQKTFPTINLPSSCRGCEDECNETVTIVLEDEIYVLRAVAKCISYDLNPPRG